MTALSPRPPRPFVPAQAYQVLSNPTRKRVLESLRSHGPAEVLLLADEFGVSTLKMRHHLRILADAGLVRLRQNRTTGEQIVKFSPIGWARVKRSWERGLSTLGGLRIVR